MIFNEYLINFINPNILIQINIDLQKENINLYVASIFHRLYQIIFLIIIFNLCNV